jgi:hypothetical protein
LKAKLINETRAAASAGNDDRLIEREGKKYFPADTIIDDPRAYRLVQMGVAVPADPECTVAAGMTSQQMEAAQRQQELLAKGIEQDDYQRYLDGEILGYDEDGNDIPGPNYKDPNGEDEE